MCVILNCKSAKPSLEVLQKCGQVNDDGAGVAWIADSKVHYKKGLNPASVFALISEDAIQFPFVIHFRNSSAGMGEKNPLLCHPFPVNRFATAKESGTASRVLFHNGHWSEWRSWCLNYALQCRGRVPFGEWSDTRAVAWAVHHKGEGILNLVPGKYAILAATGVRQYGDGWVEEDGIIYSNTQWKYNGGAAWAANSSATAAPTGVQQSFCHDAC